MAPPLLPLLLLLLALLSLSLACSDPQPLPAAICNNETSAWELSGDALVADALQLGSSDLLISGSLVVLPNATILVNSTDGRHGLLRVAGTVALSGSLNVSYASLPAKRTVNSLVVAQDIIQRFQSVHSQLLSGATCESVTVSTQQSGNSSYAVLSVVAEVTYSCPQDHAETNSVVASSVFAGLFVVAAVSVWAAAVLTSE